MQETTPFLNIKERKTVYFTHGHYYRNQAVQIQAKCATNDQYCQCVLQVCSSCHLGTNVWHLGVMY